MKSPGPILIALSLCVLGTPSPGADTHRDLSGAVTIALSHGVNRVDTFDADNHPALIIFGWRENMNAHGYGTYSVLMPPPDNPSDWNLVTFETHERDANQGSERDALYDSPFDGERLIASVRFAKASWDGKPATLAITARRDLSHTETFGDPAPVEFSIYQLVANKDGLVGWPWYYFDRVEHFTSDKRYCNSDIALAQELRLPLPDGQQPAATEDGCIR